MAASTYSNLRIHLIYAARIDETIVQPLLSGGIRQCNERTVTTDICHTRRSRPCQAIRGAAERGLHYSPEQICKRFTKVLQSKS